VPFEAQADIVVINSCAVTARAEFSDRQMIRRAARQQPHARLVVTGCWAQIKPRAVATLAGVDLVVGNGDKHRLPELLEALTADGTPRLLDGVSKARLVVSDIGAARTLAAAPRPAFTARSRAFLKTQEGCQHRCAFCIVPLARGRSRSVPADAVVAHARSLVAAGHPEIVLTGVDLGHWGADLVPRTTLAALLQALVAIPGLRWIRLSSVLPAYFTAELTELLTTSPLIAPHFHIPLQSGSDRILRRMRRPYTVAMYRRVIDRLTAAIPALGLGADVIVGFPGETDEDFAATLALVRQLPFSYLHVFAYSDREGTEAARLSERVPPRVIAERSRALRDLAQAKNRAFRERLIGTSPEVLVLETRDRATGHLIGLTGNYVEVIFSGTDSLMRRLTRVRVTEITDDRTLGELT